MRFLLLFLFAITLQAEVLTLQDLLDRVQKSYPPLLAALQDREAAEGDLLTAMGRFDTN